MLLSFLHTMFRQVVSRGPPLYAATWAILLTLTVGVASFAPETAFVSAIAPSSSFSRLCYAKGVARFPLDLPGEVFCLPAYMVKRSNLDFFVPTLFAALVVAASASLVRSFGLLEDEID
ncbi:hypothetical protein CFOL_v3_18491 [Cephalotus follicularis]|uniref:Uncharacterized protein n=1 Tax=Cephalotus follicularis TaxID=3775 RepID=A0A1Q3C4G9_CEPFO|nr:hypothetical protein CFOL_v3_18491 [Cephalotus follicularis]